MNSATSNFEVDASGVSPKQLHGIIPSLKLADGNEIPMVRPLIHSSTQPNQNQN